MGIITSGSALAGMLFPVIIDQLLNHQHISFGWMQRVIGFIALFMAIVASVCIKPGLPTRKGAYFLPEAFKNKAYTLQVLGLLVMCWGLFTVRHFPTQTRENQLLTCLKPFFYLPSYAIANGMSTSLSFYLITFLNAGSFIGRLVAGAFGVYVGQFNVLLFCASVCSVLIFAWISITSNAGIIVFAIVYGAVSGGAISTMISTLAVCAPQPNQMGTYIGMASGVFSIACLTGTPINGALLSHYHGFLAPQIFSGICAIIGSIFLLGARLAYAPISSQWRA